MKVKKLTQMATALVVLLFFSFSAKTVQAQSTGNFVNGGSATFVKKLVDFPYKSDVTYLFIINGKGWSKDGSHTNWPINLSCLDSFRFLDGGHWSQKGSKVTLNSDKSNWEFGKDGSYKNYTMYAIKHGGHGTPKGTIDSLYFTLSKNVETGPGWIFNKGGTPFDSAKLTETILFSCPLPVTFGRVYAISGDGMVSVNWTTYTELNNEKFEVERLDSKNVWVKIGEVRGAGNSSQRVDYELIDDNPQVGKNFYRVKQIDYDGRFAYSPIFSTETPYPEPGLKIYPNPAKNNEVVVISAYGFKTMQSEHIIVIRDAVGKTILQSVFNGPGNVLQLDLMSGMYQVTAIGKDEMGRDIYFHQKLMVQ